MSSARPKLEAAIENRFVTDDSLGSNTIVELPGSEEGRHLGVAGWIAKHRDRWPTISAYFNVDNGAGRLRGLWDQSNLFIAPIFQQIFTPVRDLGVMAIKQGNVGGNEYQDFDDVGVPGFTYLQDPLEYVLRSHPTNADTVANRDELIPRKR